jgi:hypothetical protein
MPFNIAANQVLAQPVSAFYQGRAIKLAEGKAARDADALAAQIEIAKHGDQRAQAQDTREEETHTTQQKAADIQLKAEDARQIYDGASKVLEQGDNAKAYVEQTFPELIPQLEEQSGHSWKDASNDQILQLATGMRDHASVQAHISKDKPISVSKGEVLLDPTTRKPVFDNNQPEHITPYQQAQLDIDRRKLKLETDKADAATNPLGLSAPNGVANAPTGGEFLSTLPKNIADQVKALSEGRMAFPSGFALKSPYWQQMLTAVSQYDPSFDAVNFNARAKTRNDFTSGKGAQNIKSLNTAIGHLGTLAGQIEGTASHSLTTVNHLQNRAAQMTGSAGPTQFKQTAGALASELTQVFRGSGGAEADVKRYLEELDVDASKEQKTAAVKNIVDLLHSRLEAIGDQYNQGMGTTKDPLTLLNPKAQAVLAKISGATSTDVSSDMPDDIAALLKKHGGK